MRYYLDYEKDIWQFTDDYSQCCIKYWDSMTETYYCREAFYNYGRDQFDSRLQDELLDLKKLTEVEVFLLLL